MTNWENTNGRQWEQLLVVVTKFAILKKRSESFSNRENWLAWFTSPLSKKPLLLGFAKPCGQMTLSLLTHRGHGHIIVKGTDLSRMFAELLG